LKKAKPDIRTISAHKIGGPKGVGALYVAEHLVKSKKIIAHIYGGGQEGELRSGTESVAAIYAFAAAAKAAHESRKERIAKYVNLRSLLLAELSKNQSTSEIRENRPAGAYAPNILSLTLPKIKSETMLNFLSAAGICLSAGSACSSHSKKASRGLSSFGLSADEAKRVLRISFGDINTEDDVYALARALAKGQETLCS
jgi:cysteine desulfurase